MTSTAGSGESTAPARATAFEFAERRDALAQLWAPWVPRTLAVHIERCAAIWQDAVLFISEGRELTYRDVAATVAELASALTADGVEPGERVGLLIGNTPDAYLMKFALSRAGAVVVPLNYLFTPNELSYVIAQARLCMIVGRGSVAGRDMHALLAGAGALQGGGAFPDLRRVALSRGSVTAADISEASVTVEADRAVGPDHLTEILYTSGSTGSPKGTMLTHENFLRNAFGSAFARGLPVGTRSILSLPTFHRLGYGEAVLPTTFAGGAVVLEEVFNAPRFLEQISEHRVNDLVCVARMAQALMDEPSLATTDISSLRSILSGGDVVPESYWRAITSVLGIGEITTAFGMTEHGISFLAPPDGPLENVVNTVGRPKNGGPSGMPEFDGLQTLCRIVDPATGEEVPAGVEGELQFSGPCVTSGYWDKPDENAAAFVDGWHRSGDIGRLRDDGCLALTGRLKEMYRSGGENVVPREVEQVIDAVDGVSQAYVVGVKDATWGEVGCACVIREQDSAVGAPEVLAACAANLARYKVPKHVLFLTRAEVPVTASGKIKKVDLVPLAEAWITAGATSTGAP